MMTRIIGHADAFRRMLAPATVKALQGMGAMSRLKTADAGPLWPRCAPCPSPRPLWLSSAHPCICFSLTLRRSSHSFCTSGTALWPPGLTTSAFPEALVTTLLKKGVVKGTELARACCLLQGLAIGTSSFSGAKRSPSLSGRPPPPPAQDLLGVENICAPWLAEDIWQRFKAPAARSRLNRHRWFHFCHQNLVALSYFRSTAQSKSGTIDPFRVI